MKITEIMGRFLYAILGAVLCFVVGLKLTQSLFGSDLIPKVILLVMGAILGAILKAFFDLKNQLAMDIYRKRQQAYSKLIGYGNLIPNLYLNWGWLFICSEYSRRIFEISGVNFKSELFSEFKWARQESNRNLEYMENRFSELCENIGIIVGLIRRDKELVKLAENALNLRRFIINNPNQISALNKLLLWRTSEESRLEQFVISDVREPLRLLVQHISKKVLK